MTCRKPSACGLLLIPKDCNRSDTRPRTGWCAKSRYPLLSFATDVCMAMPLVPAVEGERSGYASHADYGESRSCPESQWWRDMTYRTSRATVPNDQGLPLRVGIPSEFSVSAIARRLLPCPFKVLMRWSPRSSPTFIP